MQQKLQKIEIEIPQDKAEGVYSNFVGVIHSPSEFIFDFAKFLPGLKKAKVVARVIMSPQHAKSFLKTLEENIKKYEENFGEIKLPGELKEKKIGFSPEE